MNASGGRGSPETEIEWQLDALALRPVERWLAERAGTAPDQASDGLPGLEISRRPVRRLVDVYLDTEDWRVGRAGYVLRVRSRAGQLEATLKDQTEAVAGLRRRFEATQPLPSAGAAAPGAVQALGGLDASGAVGRRLRALANGRRLRQIFEVHTRRQPFELRLEGERVGEIALDETAIAVPDEHRRLKLQRIEVEVSPGRVETLRPFVERLRRDCGLQPATLSKFEAGLLASGLAIPGKPDLGPTAVGPATSTGDLAYAVLRRDAAAMIAHEPGTRLGEDIEALHQMRVATRRMRAALDLFAAVLPARATHFRSELGWLADALGRVRDLDIQLSHFDAWSEAFPPDEDGTSPLAELAELLEAERARARAELLEALDSRRYERLVAGLVAMLRSGPIRRSALSRQAAAISMVPLISDRHQAAVRAARRARRTGVATDYHRLRIRCKRLRYSLEFTAGLYEDEIKAYARQLAKLQDELGLMQDAEVAATRLRALALSDTGAVLSRRTIFVMGGLAERYRAECAARLSRLRPFVKCLRGGDARKALAAMDRRRAEAEAAAARLPPRSPLRAAPAAPAERPVRGPAGETTIPTGQAGETPPPPVGAAAGHPSAGHGPVGSARITPLQRRGIGGSGGSPAG